MANAVRDYLKLIGKYRHLTDAQIDHIRGTVNDRIANLRQMTQIGSVKNSVRPS